MSERVALLRSTNITHIVIPTYTLSHGVIIIARNLNLQLQLLGNMSKDLPIAIHLQLSSFHRHPQSQPVP